MSKCLILAAALIAVAASDGAAQARAIDTTDTPAAAARQADGIQVAAMNSYLRLKGQKAGSSQAAPATPDRKRSGRSRDGIIVAD